MEAFIVKAFEVLFKTVGVLLVCGLMGNVLSDLLDCAPLARQLTLRL